MEASVILEAEVIELEDLLAGDIDLKGFLKGDKGDAFEFEDFTPEQLESLRGPSAVQVSMDPPTNDDILIWLDEAGNEELGITEGDLAFLTNTDIDNLLKAMA